MTSVVTPHRSTGLDAGKLRHRVTIQRPLTVPDSDGGMTTQWEDVATVWASIEPLSAREYMRASTLQSKVTARIIIRYRPGIEASMRVLHGADVYDIHGVLRDNISMNEWMTLPVSSGVNDG